MLDLIQGFHLELTNMCTLKCPRCARTKFIEQFPNRWTNKNLNLDQLISFLDVDLTGKEIHLGGVYGDAIYYNQLFDIVNYFKSKDCRINIATNGSYRTKDWWEKLASLLDANDQIVLGIDGLPSNFTQYRVNADWDSIKIGIDVLTKSAVRTVWQYIPFSFNEDNIEEAQNLATNLGIDEFLVLPSDRWDGIDDWLLPSKHITGDRTTSILKWKNNDRSMKVLPLCKTTNNYHFISAEGFYMPCAFINDYRFYYKSEFYKNKEQYDISKTTLTKILQSTQTVNFYSSIEKVNYHHCTFNCPKL